MKGMRLLRAHKITDVDLEDNGSQYQAPETSEGEDVDLCKDKKSSQDS